MNDDTREGLIDVAEALVQAAGQLAGLVKDAHDQEVTSEVDQPDEDEPSESYDEDARWMRGARRELAELLREIEAPNPPQAAQAYSVT